VDSFDSRNGTDVLESNWQQFPTSLTSQRRQLDEYCRQEFQRVLVFDTEHFSWLQPQCMTAYDGSSPAHIVVQGLGKESRNRAESVLLFEFPWPRLGGTVWWLKIAFVQNAGNDQSYTSKIFLNA